MLMLIHCRRPSQVFVSWLHLRICNAIRMHAANPVKPTALHDRLVSLVVMMVGGPGGGVLRMRVWLQNSRKGGSVLIKSDSP